MQKVNSPTPQGVPGVSAIREERSGDDGEETLEGGDLFALSDREGDARVATSSSDELGLEVASLQPVYQTVEVLVLRAAQLQDAPAPVVELLQLEVRLLEKQDASARRRLHCHTVEPAQPIIGVLASEQHRPTHRVDVVTQDVTTLTLNAQLELFTFHPADQLRLSRSDRVIELASGPARKSKLNHNDPPFL